MNSMSERRDIRWDTMGDFHVIDKMPQDEDSLACVCHDFCFFLKWYDDTNKMHVMGKGLKLPNGHLVYIC